MKRVNVWFNHWFSTAYHIINLLKDDKEIQFHVIGTGSNPNSVVRTVCDEWFDEPTAETEDGYVDESLAFCKAHDVQVFVPRHHQLAISRRIGEFHAIGVQVLVGDAETISILQDKRAAYELFDRLGIGILPQYRVVTTRPEFEQAYQELVEQYEQVCMKFVADEGGKSYRLIVPSISGYEGLFRKQSTRMPYNKIIEALSEVESFPPLMLMPYLPDEELSVDCLRTDSGIIMVPRIKYSGRLESIGYDEGILATCQSFYDQIGIEGPCNIQFKYLHGIPYFLEVNTRMSGGVHMSCNAAGVNIPNIAVNRLLGIEKPWKIDRTIRRFSQVGYQIFLD